MSGFIKALIVCIGIIASYSGLSSQTTYNPKIVNSVMGVTANLNTNTHKHTPFPRNMVIEEPTWNIDTIIMYSASNSLIGRMVYTYRPSKDLESSQYDSWDGEQWNPSLRSTASYNDKGLPTEIIVMVGELDSWKNYNRFTYTYNEAMDMLTNTYEIWESNKWIVQTRSTYTYNGAGYQESYLREASKNDILEKVSLWLYTYDASGNVDTTIRKNWNNTDWEYFSKFNYTYDSLNRETSNTLSFWDNNTWNPYSKDTLLYDDNGNLTSKQSNGWYAFGWDTGDRILYKYDNANNMIEQLNQVFLSQKASFKNTTRLQYSYDQQSYLLTEIAEEWNDGSNGWNKEYKKSYTYDANGNSVAGVYQEGSGDTWVLSDDGELNVYSGKAVLNDFSEICRYEAHFIPLDQVSDVTTDSETGIHVFPNPAYDIVRIQVGRPQNLQVSLYTIQGILLSSQSVSNRDLVTMNLAAFPGGMYTVRITNDSGLEKIYQIIKR